jgi:hypothetical protein
MSFIASDIHDTIIQWLTRHSIKHETSSFPSGAYMIDIWRDERFFVIQIDNRSIGFSEVEGSDFSTLPDMRFSELDSLIRHLQMLLVPD